MVAGDGLKREPKDSVRDLPERFHDQPFSSSLPPSSSSFSITNVPIASVRSTKPVAPRISDDINIKIEPYDNINMKIEPDGDDSDGLSSRARKRPRLDDGDVPDPSTVKNVKTIAEQLTALDSDSFDDYIRCIESLRKLTSAEVAEVKKMKRRIANRESARKSRQEKREHTDLLDQQIRQLTDELHATKLEVASLTAQNLSLRSEITFSYHLIAANPVLAQLYADLKVKHEARRATSSTLASPLMPAALSTSASSSSASPSAPSS